MVFLKFFIFFFLLFCFVTCGSEPRLKKIPVPEKTIKNLESTYNSSIDILFIIDDSASMGDEQELLSKNAKTFIDHFLNVSFINYHIGVTTSSTNNIRNSLAGDGTLNSCREVIKKYDKSYNYFNYVDRKTYKGADCLKEMLGVGEDGAFEERFLNIPELVFFPKQNVKDYHADFYRQDAHLGIFVITDTHDQSETDPQEAYEFLLNLKDGDQNKIHYALGTVKFEAPPSCRADNSGSPKNMKLQRMVKLFGPRGYKFNICKPDYGIDLAKFATHLVHSVLTIPLKDVPDISSIEVYYEYGDDNIQSISKGPQGWSYDSNKNAIHLSPDIQLENDGKFRIKYQPLYTSER